ncbi:hypothetical protein [Curtobacterium sp. TC1]|uniref:hypothetical protein n=1 Tax=Curtobacterium sp. TC1 TaxID=2862880 RepID=UPI0021C1569F|nr:hypothetical protein [Curtobacterium sp. TC1]
MTTLRLLSLRLLRAVTAVAAAVLLLLGAVTLQTNTAHTDTPVTALTTTVADGVTAMQADPGTAYLDAHDGSAGMFCALPGFAALVITAAVTLALACAVATRNRPLFTLSGLLARSRPRRVFDRWSTVSLTRLAVSRI